MPKRQEKRLNSIHAPLFPVGIVSSCFVAKPSNILIRVYSWKEETKLPSYGRAAWDHFEKLSSTGGALQKGEHFVEIGENENCKSGLS